MPMPRRAEIALPTKIFSGRVVLDAAFGFLNPEVPSCGLAVGRFGIPKSPDSSLEIGLAPLLACVPSPFAC
jgi:hypothetical protein